MLGIAVPFFYFMGRKVEEEGSDDDAKEDESKEK